MYVCIFMCINVLETICDMLEFWRVCWMVYDVYGKNQWIKCGQSRWKGHVQSRRLDALADSARTQTRCSPRTQMLTYFNDC